MELEKELFEKERRLETSDLSLKSISTSLQDNSIFTNERDNNSNVTNWNLSHLYFFYLNSPRV